MNNQEANSEESMSKRERFAMAAMQGLVKDSEGYANWNDLAYDAVELAEATLRELENTEQ